MKNIEISSYDLVNSSSEFAPAIFTVEPENWESELCLDTLSKLIYKIEFKDKIEKRGLNEFQA